MPNFSWLSWNIFAPNRVSPVPALLKEFCRRRGGEPAGSVPSHIPSVGCALPAVGENASFNAVTSKSMLRFPRAVKMKKSESPYEASEPNHSPLEGTGDGDENGFGSAPSLPIFALLA